MYPEKKKSSQKYRTDLSTDTEYPKFSKNVFKFDDISLGNRVLLKFGCFRAKDNVDINRPSQVTQGCTLYGSASKLLTQSFITKMRRSKVLEETLILVDPDNNLEVGRITIVYKLKLEELEDRIYEDVREIEKFTMTHLKVVKTTFIPILLKWKTLLLRNNQNLMKS